MHQRIKTTTQARQGCPEDTAKQVCQHCPVINDCATWALKTREPYGVWGGMSEDERATVLGVRSLRYPAPAPGTAG